MLTVQVFLIAAIATLLWKLYGYAVSNKLPQGMKRLPGPKGYPLIGSLLEFPKTFGYHKFKEWSDTYGPIFQVNLLGKTHIVISDEEVANDLLALRGAHYSDRPRLVMHHELVSGGGNLGTSPQNKYWRNARKFAAATLSSKTLEGWNAVQTDEALRMVCDLIATPSNYEYLFERYSSLVMLRMLYDRSVSEIDEKEHVKTITEIVRTLERTTAPGAYFVDFLPCLKYLPEILAPFKSEGRVCHQFEYSYFRGLVTDAQKRHSPNRKLGKSPRALVHAYLDKKDFWNLSDFEVTYCMGTLFEGGSGTTSAAMQSFCLAMWHYPEWQAKIQQEIDQVVGDRIPSFEDWPNLPTVRAATKETLRWRPIVPAGSHLIFIFCFVTTEKIF